MKDRGKGRGHVLQSHIQKSIGNPRRLLELAKHVWQVQGSQVLFHMEQILDDHEVRIGVCQPTCRVTSRSFL